MEQVENSSSPLASHAVTSSAWQALERLQQQTAATLEWPLLSQEQPDQDPAVSEGVKHELLLMQEHHRLLQHESEYSVAPPSVAKAEAEAHTADLPAHPWDSKGSSPQEDGLNTAMVCSMEDEPQNGASLLPGQSLATSSGAVEEFIAQNPQLDASATSTLRSLAPDLQDKVLKKCASGGLHHANNPSAFLVSLIKHARDQQRTEMEDFIAGNPQLDASATSTLRALAPDLQDKVLKMSARGLQHAKNPSAFLVSLIKHARDQQRAGHKESDVRSALPFGAVIGPPRAEQGSHAPPSRNRERQTAPLSDSTALALRRASPAGAPVTKEVAAAAEVAARSAARNVAHEVEELLAWYAIDDAASNALRQLPPMLQQEVLALQSSKGGLTSKELWCNIKSIAGRAGLIHSHDCWIKQWDSSSSSSAKLPQPPAAPPPAEILWEQRLRTRPRPIVVPPPRSSRRRGHPDEVVAPGAAGLLRSRLWKGVRRKRFLEQEVEPPGQILSRAYHPTDNPYDAVPPIRKRMRAINGTWHSSAPPGSAMAALGSQCSSPEESEDEIALELRQVMVGMAPTTKDGLPVVTPRSIPISFSRQGMMIGRAKACDIVLQAKHMSKHHAHLCIQETLEDPGFMLSLKDTSSNGTWLNGQKLEHGRYVQVRVGDTLSFLPPADADSPTEQLSYKVCQASAPGPGEASSSSRGAPGHRAKLQQPRIVPPPPPRKKRSSDSSPQGEPDALTVEDRAPKAAQGAIADQLPLPAGCGGAPPQPADEAAGGSSRPAALCSSQGLQPPKEDLPDPAQAPDACGAGASPSAAAVLELGHTVDGISWWLAKLGLESFSDKLMSRFGGLWEIRDQHAGNPDGFFKEMGIDEAEHQRLFRHGFEWLRSVHGVTTSES